MSAPQSWLQRALRWAITFVVVALLIRWGWEIIRPFVPLILGISFCAVLIKLWLSYYRRS
jgi:hypothetical protein